MSRKRSNQSPQISRVESFVDSKDMVKNPIEVIEEYRKKLGPTFTFYFGGMKRTVLSADPEFIKHVLKDNQTNYHKSDIQVKRMGEFQGQGLLNSHGDQWLRQRRFLSMGFTRSRLKELWPLQCEVLNQFMTSFAAEAEKKPVDIRDQMVKFTLRTVGKSLFGRSMQDGELNRLGDAISRIQAFIVRQVVQPYKIPWFRISGQTEQFQKIRREADQIVRDYVQQRRRRRDRELDLLQQIIETPYKDSGVFMDDEKVVVELLQLLVAGNETSSNTLSWTFYLLAKHPEHVVAMREEIEATLGDREMDYESLHKLTYVVGVLNEAMRLYPPFWMIDRVALDKDEICGLEIPAGTTVVPYIYGVHRNVDIWEDPDRFDPIRFMGKNKRHPFAHIPFGGGGRVCIGQNMAIMQMLLVIVAVVRRYDFKLDPDKTIDKRAMMILRPDGPIRMDFAPIPAAV